MSPSFSKLDQAAKTSLVKETRERFMELVKKNPDSYDKLDIEWLGKADLDVERFLMRKKYDVKESVKMLDETMRWRNETGIPRLTDQDFPKEFFEVGSIFEYEPDQNGVGVIYLRVRKLLSLFSALDDLKLKFILYMMNKIDRRTGSDGYVLVYDWKGASLGSLDMEQSLQLAKIMRQYFPEGLKYVLVYELPWLLVQSWKLIRSKMPLDLKVIMVNHRQIFDYIDPANVPREMGGKCPLNYLQSPEGCESLETIGKQLKLSESDIDKAIKEYGRLIWCGTESCLNISNSTKSNFMTKPEKFRQYLNNILNTGWPSWFRTYFKR